MLIRAQNNYGLNLFDAVYNLQETGIMDTQTGAAIKAIIAYRKKGNSIFSSAIPAPVIGSSSITALFYPDSQITPDDENYIFLLKCSLKPICTDPQTLRKVDFNNDPMAVQALSGKLNFPGFKALAEAKDNAACGESDNTNYCGVNPVTGKPGINAVSSGILGELRPGEGGNGNFKGRSNNEHDAIDIRAPVGTPIYACRDGVVEQITRPPGGMGNRVILKHSDGIFTHYAHLLSFAPGIEVKTPRVKVTEGQLLGYAGRTGNVPAGQKEKEDHVHFGVSTVVRPLPQSSEWKNPVKYLNECILTTKEGN